MASLSLIIETIGRKRLSLSVMAAAAHEQLALFDTGVNLGRLRIQARALIAAGARATNTERAYGSAWRAFLRWCAAAGRCGLPATEDTVCLYLVDLSNRVKVATVFQHVYAIRRFHAASGLALPVGSDVRAILAGLRRIRGSEHRPKAAIAPKELARMIAAIDVETKRGTRDAAVLLFGFAAGLRRADLVALDLADLEFTDRGVLVRVGRNRREKNDQAGKGRDIPIFHGARRETCPVLAVQRWLSFRSREPGPLFTRCDPGAPELARLSAHAVRLIVRRAADAIGLEPASYGAHSLRAGMITACAAGGASDSTIMQRSGHASVEMVRRYRRHADLFYDNPLVGAL